MPRVHRIIIAAMLVSTLLPFGCATSDGPQVDRLQLRELYPYQRSRIQTIQYTLDVKTSIESTVAGELLDAGFEQRLRTVKFAMDGQKLMRRETIASRKTRFVGFTKPTEQALAYDGRIESAFGRSGQIRTQPSRALYFSGDYWPAIGAGLGDMQAQTTLNYYNDLTAVFTQWYASAKQWNKRVTIRGVETVVATFADNVFYLDPEMQYAPRRVEASFTWHGAPVIVMIDAYDHKKVAKDLYLPMRVVERWARVGHGDQPFLERNMQVSDLRVNREIDPAVFSPADIIPPGALVNDQVRNEVYHRPTPDQPDHTGWFATAKKLLLIDRQ